MFIAQPLSGVLAGVAIGVSFVADRRTYTSYQHATKSNFTLVFLAVLSPFSFSDIRFVRLKEIEQTKKGKYVP